MNRSANLIQSLEASRAQLEKLLTAEADELAQAGSQSLRSWSEAFAEELATRLLHHHEVWLKGTAELAPLTQSELISVAEPWERKLAEMTAASARDLRNKAAIVLEGVDWAAVDNALRQPATYPAALLADLFSDTALDPRFKDLAGVTASMAVTKQAIDQFSWDNCRSFCRSVVQFFSETLGGHYQIALRDAASARMHRLQVAFQKLEEALGRAVKEEVAVEPQPERAAAASPAPPSADDPSTPSGMSELTQKSREFLAQVGPALERAATVADSLGLADIATALRERNEALTQHHFVVLIFGRFRCGKSTFLNALLGKPTHPIPNLPPGAGALPTDINPCTARPTRIYYADEPKVRMIPLEGEGEDWTFEQYYRQSRQRPTRSENEACFDHIDGFELGFPTPFCMGGIDLYDAPGTDDSPDLDLVTLDLADKADAIVFVTSHPAPMGMSEEAYLRNLEMGGLPSFLTVINGRDQDPSRGKFAMPPTEETQSSIWDRMVTRYRDGGPRNGKSLEEADIFYLNGLQAFQARMNDDAEGVRKSGILEFERRLGRYLAEERHVRHAERHLSSGQAKLADLRREIDVQCAALQVNRETLSSRLKDLQGKVDEIPQQASQIPGVIKRHREQCVIAIQQSLEELFDRIAADLPGYMNKQRLPSLQREGFFDQLAAIGAGLTSSRKKVCREAMELAYRYVLDRIDQWRTAPIQQPGAGKILAGSIYNMLQDLKTESISLERKYSDLQKQLTGWVLASEEIEAKGSSLAARIRAVAVAALGGEFDYSVSADEESFDTPYSSVVTDLVRGNPTLFSLPGVLPVAFMFDIAWDAVCGVGSGGVESYIKSKTVAALLHGYAAIPERNVPGFDGIAGQARRNSETIGAAVGKKFSVVEENVMREINDRVQLEKNSIIKQQADAARSAEERAAHLQVLATADEIVRQCEAQLAEARAGAVQSSRPSPDV